MRRLIIANTYYQVIFAMQMRNTIFKRDDVDLIITDHSKNADVVCENIKKCKSDTVHVYTVKTIIRRQIGHSHCYCSLRSQ